MTNSFLKCRLVYKASELIARKRQELLGDLVSYAKDPVRYQRRMYMLIDLANYEVSILTKIKNFETNDDTDLEQDMLDIIQREILSVTNPDA